MALDTTIKSDVDAILTEHGVTATVYLSPTYTLDEEGAATITKNTGTSAKALIFSPSGNRYTQELEGVDANLEYECYLEYDVGTLTEESIILIDSKYYSINSVNKNPLSSSTVTFYKLNITKIQPQSSVS